MLKSGRIARGTLSFDLKCKVGQGGRDSVQLRDMLVDRYTSWLTRWHSSPLPLVDTSAGIVRVQRAPLSLCAVLQREQGVHRFVRRRSGKRQTSFVAVTLDSVQQHGATDGLDRGQRQQRQAQPVLAERDLRWDTFRASGPGGQHVNTTNSAVRLVHLPTGTTVTVQAARDQRTNRKEALTLMYAKLREVAGAEAAAASRARHRASDSASFGSGWIRSYTLDGRVAQTLDARSGIRLDHRGGVRAWADAQAFEDLVMATLQWEAEQEQHEASSPGSG